MVPVNMFPQKLDFAIANAALRLFQSAREAYTEFNASQRSVITPYNALDYHVMYADMTVAMAVIGAMASAPLGVLGEPVAPLMNAAHGTIRILREGLLETLSSVAGVPVFDYNAAMGFAGNAAVTLLPYAYHMSTRIEKTRLTYTLEQDAVLAGFMAASARSLEILSPTFEHAEIYDEHGIPMPVAQITINACNRINSDFIESAMARQMLALNGGFTAARPQ